MAGKPRTPATKPPAKAGPKKVEGQTVNPTEVQGNDQPAGATVLPGANATVGGATSVAIQVSSKTDGFRRAGRAWTKEPVTVPLEELSEEQVEALLQEPELTVSFLDE